MPEMMSTLEVADYLRIKQRKVYELVGSGRIPCTRVTGKWLFPKTLIDLWVLQSCKHNSTVVSTQPAPPVIGGSHDPLLDWAARESGSELALLFGGSLHGLRAFAARKAGICGLHVFDPDTESYNIPIIERTLAGFDIVVIEWARRDQGLIVAACNPLGIRSIKDLCKPGVRFQDRQQGAGSQMLFAHLLAKQQLSINDLSLPTSAALNETDVALAVQTGDADAGFGIRSVAGQFHLDFIPLHIERYDLIVGRRDYFEPPSQKLLSFAHGRRFADRAKQLGGYDVSDVGRVVFNAP